MASVPRKRELAREYARLRMVKMTIKRLEEIELKQIRKIMRLKEFL